MITSATPADYPDIVRIYNQAITAGSQPAEEEVVSLEDKLPWLQQHTGDHYVIYVASHNENVIGYLALSPYRFGRSGFTKTAEISYYIDRHHQGNGIGKIFMQYAIEQCPQREIETLIAILLACNTASIALLEKYEFKQWGCMPNIAKLKNGGVDHLYYGRHLI